MNGSSLQRLDCQYMVILWGSGTFLLAVGCISSPESSFPQTDLNQLVSSPPAQRSSLRVLHLSASMYIPAITTGTGVMVVEWDRVVPRGHTALEGESSLCA